MDMEQPIPTGSDREPTEEKAFSERLLGNLERRAACEEAVIRHEMDPSMRADPLRRREMRRERQVAEDLDGVIHDEVIELLLEGTSVDELRDVGISPEYLAELRARSPRQKG